MSSSNSRVSLFVAALFAATLMSATGCSPKSESADSDTTMSREEIARAISKQPEPMIGGNETAGLELSSEPTYESKPYYVRIAVGPNREKLFWAAADVGDHSVYVDVNGDGELNGDDEWFELVETSSYLQTRYLEATVPELKQGEDTHTELKIKLGVTTGDDGDSEKVKGVFSLKLWGWDDSTTDADLVTLEMRNDLAEGEDSPLVHFNGPLRMGNYRQVVEMARGKEEIFYSLIGTPGESGGTLTAITNTEITDDAHPKAEFIFPHVDSSQPPIKVSIQLMTRC